MKTNVTVAASAKNGSDGKPARKTVEVSKDVPTVAAGGSSVVASVAAPTAIRPRSYPDAARIELVATANPKRPGSKAYPKFFYGELPEAERTVGGYVAAFLSRKLGPRRRAFSALRWDAGHGFIKIG